MPAPSPLDIANQAQHLAKSASAADAVVFNRVAMVCMGAMALASVAQALHTVLRDLNRHHEPPGRGR